ncbi:MAG: fused MFS/spermidine synthase [Deltaproteobacteria bacterium]|nr:fused MFS/spermidine synthase [Deltaproteobacteria bacterium]
MWLYAWLEAGVALGAAASPLLLVAARAGYMAAGGTSALGPTLGTLLRLLLAAIVLLPPTLLMGGTLPAAARAAVCGGDTGRRTTGLLYGANTLGAVAGAFGASFLMLEVFGTRLTLWLGCLLNALVVLGARSLGRSLPPAAAQSPPSESPAAGRAPGATPSLVLLCAGAVGFAFLLMELVWYRMLAPLLGGTSYTFGLILAVALLGIGLGGLLYAWRPPERPATLAGFSLSCALEALLVAAPYALGDRIALLALFLRPLGVFGLGGHVAGWSVVTALVVLPAALVSGYQFPLLIALLGRAERHLGREVGLAYAANTLGAIAGSLAGGFVLLPAMGALGSWRLAACILFALALLAAVSCRPVRGAALGLPVAVSFLGPAALLASTGPTAVWRHTPIGAGRVDSVVQQATRNSVRRFMRDRRRAVTWEAEGRESSIALNTLADTAFLVSGKSDGEAVSDAPTQVMGGLLGALLLEADPRTALVVGLGTGSTAGWLGALPAMERVDVVEIEPAIVHVARLCAPVNHDALRNPKLHLATGDGREVLLTTPRRYDLIFSEPSNPYRAGIASLFTREFYQAVRRRLRPGGVFVQFVQGYEIDAAAVSTIYSTLAAELGSIETWRTKTDDLLLVARERDRVLDPAALRRRIAGEPYRSALVAAWRADSLEGVLAHYVASPALARRTTALGGAAAINTDDRNLLEFAVARSLGRPQGFDVEELVLLAQARGEGRPELSDPSAVDWARVQDAHVAMGIAVGNQPAPLLLPALSADQEHRYLALLRWSQGRHRAAIAEWEAQPREPEGPIELMVMADARAAVGDDAAEPLIEKLGRFQPVEALALRAKLCWARGEARPAYEALRAALRAYRRDPWPAKAVMEGALLLGTALAERDPSLLGPLFELYAEPLVLSSLRYLREAQRLDLGLRAEDPRWCVEALRPMEPHVPWEASLLSARLRCYERAHHPLEKPARAELEELLADEGQAWDAGW